MHQHMETPFFAHRLGAGNAVVGAWLKVYNDKDCDLEFPTEGTVAARSKPIPKPWWDKAPKRVTWNKKGTLSRKQNQIYHFLLPDDNMVPSYGIKLLKNELSEIEITAFKDWRNDFKQPLTSVEINRLKKISKVVDYLLDEHYKQQMGMVKDTASVYQVYGQPNPQTTTKGYDEKERLTDSRKDRSAPYFKLKMILDYWCSLWFWDVRDVRLLPNRTEWYNEVESILQIDSNELLADGSSQDIKDQIRKKAKAGTLFDNSDRIENIEQLAQQHRFFHNEIEFIEVFYERGGFDVIVGNPPWLKLQFEEKGIMSESFPELEIRKTTASQVRTLQQNFIAVEAQKDLYFEENIAVDSAGSFMNAHQNYPLQKGQSQASNLYRGILENTLSLLNLDGFSGLVHPEGIYDDPKGKILRKEVFKRLKYHFQFKNELTLFSEVHHETIYSTNIYAGKKDEVNFTSLHNLFHPSTIDNSINHSGAGLPGGFKVMDESQGKMVWNVEPHKDRVVNIKEDELRVLARLFEDSTDWATTKLVSIHTTQILNVLSKLSEFGEKLDKYPYYITDGWRETDAINSGIIKRETKWADIEEYELIVSGPHFFVSNPLYKNPYEDCKLNSDYDVIHLDSVKSDFAQRTVFLPLIDTVAFAERFEWKNKKKSTFWIDQYKLAFSKMLSITGERTLQPAILAPKVSHNSGVISVLVEDEKQLIELCALCSSLVLDFYVKSMGRSNFYESSIKMLILGVDEQYLKRLSLRVLLLNALTENYTNLWEDNYDVDFRYDSWSKEDARLKPFNDLTEEWKWETPLRNWFERRQALVEIDVITAIAFGLSLEELILMYNVQFPVLQQNEEDTWYDTKGNIVFTCSKGLTGVGLDRGDWNTIADMKAGQTYEHTITKSELYQGKKATYYAPFTKCDRVEDYKTAWAHFESIFKTEKAVV